MKEDCVTIVGRRGIALKGIFPNRETDTVELGYNVIKGT
jgi:hypothetical protein